MDDNNQSYSSKVYDCVAADHEAKQSHTLQTMHRLCKDLAPLSTAISIFGENYEKLIKFIFKTLIHQ